MARKTKGRSERPQDAKNTLRLLWMRLMQYKWLLLLAVLVALSGNLFALVGPVLSGKAIDAIPGEGTVDFDTVFFYAALMLVFYVSSSLLSYLLSALMRTISRRISHKMREDVFAKLMRLPVRFFDQNAAGDIISRVSYDIDVVSTSLSTDVAQVVASVVTVFGSLTMMIAVCPQLVPAVLVTIPVSLFYSRLMAKRVRPLYAMRSKKYGELNGFSEEMFSGQKTIRAYAYEDVAQQSFDAINEAAANAYYESTYYSSMVGPIVSFINNLSLTLVAMTGSVLFLYRIISLGQISSFVLYTKKFSGPINEAANITNELLSALAAAERVFKLLNEPEEPADLPDAVQLTKVEGEVELEHVDFGYLPEIPVLRDLCIDAKPGSTVAIVGPTGAGKTTVISLLMRFYDPDSGTIRVDGHENREIALRSLRRAYAMVLQDTWLFRGTVFENIAYGREGATLEEVIEAAKAAKIHNAIMRLPYGYDTVLGDNDGSISKGQKQQITIARAMLYDARMLILDEATSNVDTVTERRIQAAMQTLMEGKTCFIIAHRLSTVQNADCILVLDGGRIAERGTHAELMAKRGFYYKLYASQFE